MKAFQSNLLVRFSVVSFVIILAIAMVIGSLLTDKLNEEIDMLYEHGHAMMQGMPMDAGDPYSIPNLAANVQEIKWLTGGAFAARLGIE